MPNITITLTDTQYRGLEYVAVSPEEWAINAVSERARTSNDEIVQLTITHCLNNGIQVPSTREEIVSYAFDNNIVTTAYERSESIVSPIIVPEEPA